MKKYSILILFLLLALASLLSACSGSAAAGSWPGLTAGQDRAYLAFNQFVYAIDLNTGTQIWRFPAEKAESNITFFAPPTLTTDGKVLVGSYSQGGKKPILYSLDAETGQVLNQFDGAKNNYISSSLVTDGGIYAPNADHNLYALDNNLNLRWQFSTERAIWASPISNTNCECVYIASMDHHLYAVDAKTGTLRWSSDDLGGALVAPPTFDDQGKLYLGTSDKQMIALDTQNGNQIWVYNTPGWIWSGASLQDGILYFGDLEGNLIALDSATGTEKWTVKADGAIVSQPLAYNDQIYYSTENANVYAVDLNGAPTWRQETNAKVYAPVVASNDLILVAMSDKDIPLVAYDLDGRLKWSFSLATKK